MLNERDKQTYYGVVNLFTQQCLIQPYKAGNSEATVAFLTYLLQKFPTRRIVLIWDGASYHR
ncbi:MAG: transposase [Plectolyngbya sp. WJT66-NPBG17]|nr:transposase [Plectolyngbya sp. WJT66-NPBG17]